MCMCACVHVYVVAGGHKYQQDHTHFIKIYREVFRETLRQKFSGADPQDFVKLLLDGAEVRVFQADVVNRLLQLGIREYLRFRDECILVFHP